MSIHTEYRSLEQSAHIYSNMNSTHRDRDYSVSVTIIIRKQQLVQITRTNDVATHIDGWATKWTRTAHLFLSEQLQNYDQSPVLLSHICISDSVPCWRPTKHNLVAPLRVFGVSDATARRIWTCRRMCGLNEVSELGSFFRSLHYSPHPENTICPSSREVQRNGTRLRLLRSRRRRI